jgi:hypothetical protein
MLSNKYAIPRPRHSAVQRGEEKVRNQTKWSEEVTGGAREDRAMTVGLPGSGWTAGGLDHPVNATGGRVMAAAAPAADSRAE